eukprot:SAG31_NODE_2104_length_6434_cov_3.690608_7_plen_49_part_00
MYIISRAYVPVRAARRLAAARARRAPVARDSARVNTEISLFVAQLLVL